MPSETRVSNVKKQEHKFSNYDDKAECRQETLANVPVEVERQCQQKCYRHKPERIFKFGKGVHAEGSNYNSTKFDFVYFGLYSGGRPYKTKP